MIALEASLRAKRAEGRKLLVPYVTGGLGDDWLQTIEALAAAGADAIEIGVPFSDPVMDGPVIQAASTSALAAGATPESVLAGIATLDVDIPLAVMLYYNTVFRFGHERFAARLRSVGVGAVIVPDLPLIEAGEWREAASAEGIACIQFVAPTTPDEDLSTLCEAAGGFVYGVGLLGVTGERDGVAASAADVARRAKAVTDMPVLIGVGISTPEQALAATVEADGVIIGTAVVRRMVEGLGPLGVAKYIAGIRSALDA